MNLYICSQADSRPPLLDFYYGLPEKLRRKLTLEFLLLASTPPALLMEPHVKHFRLERYNQLYELRAKGKILVRIIYAYHRGDVLLLHPFLKHQPRDTEKALEAALKLLDAVTKGDCSVEELPIKDLEDIK